MKRPILIACVIAEVAGMALVGYTAVKEVRAPETVSLAHVVSANGVGVRIDSAEVQARGAQTLFVFRGAWPQPGALKSDLRIVANGTAVVLHPNATANSFELGPVGTKVSARDVGASIQQGALLLAVPSAVAKTPVRFEFGLWDGQNYTARVPREGSLIWNGTGVPTPSPDSAPARTALTAQTDECTTIPTGKIAAFLRPGQGIGRAGTDPRTNKATREVGVPFPAGATGPKTTGPYSVTAVVLPAGATSPSMGSVVDRAGTRQFWFTWDGKTRTKGVREWDGSKWTERTNDKADDLTLRFTRPTDNGPLQAIEFFSQSLKRGDRFGFVVAARGACAASMLDKTLTPTGVVP